MISPNELVRTRSSILPTVPVLNLVSVDTFSLPPLNFGAEVNLGFVGSGHFCFLLTTYLHAVASCGHSLRNPELRVKCGHRKKLPR